MLREFRVNYADAPSAMFKAGTELKTGMGVVKNYVDGTLELPSSATAEGIFLVYKMPYPTGRDAAFDDFSDYYEPFHTVDEGEFAVAYSYDGDSAFGTDQYAATITAASLAAGPKYVAVGTDGKWDIAASGENSKYLATKIYDDAGHALLHVEVVDAGANA